MAPHAPSGAAFLPVGGGLVLALAAVVSGAAAQVQLARRRYRKVVASLGGVESTALPGSAILADGRPLELVALGDSAMAGVGVDRLADTLPVLIADRVAAATGRPVHVVSHGRSGAGRRPSRRTPHPRHRR